MANTTNIIPDKLTMYQRVDGGFWHYRVKLMLVTAHEF